MAEGILGHALAAAFRHFLIPASESTPQSYPSSFPDATPITHTDTKSPVWNLFNLRSSSATSPPLVVMGQTSSSFVTLIELANQFSPEFLMILMFCGVVGIVAFTLYLFIKILSFVSRPIKRYLFGQDTSSQADLSQLSDAARQVYALVQLQNPGLFAQSPVPINTPRRTRASTRNRR